MIVGVTGHRPHKFAFRDWSGYDATNPLCVRIQDTLRSTLVELDATRGISGMAIGVDQWFVEACIALGIPFTAAVPFLGQDDRWPAPARNRYQTLLAKAERVVYVCNPGYARWKMQARNEWVVDHCNQLVAVWDGSPGGTANTVLYANNVQRTLRRIDPNILEDACQTVVNP